MQWQRAETLGALVNGVFLVALCVSIFLEAIQRLVEPQEVSNPKFVCIVGCLGLLSNMLGLVLFHDHSHGHGHSHGDGHERENLEDVDAAEQGYGRQDAAINQQDAKTRKDGSTTEPTSPYSHRRRTLDGQSRPRRYSTSTGRGVEDITHPATLRQEIIAASRSNLYGGTDSTSESESDARDAEPSERSTLLRHKDQASNYTDEDSTPIAAPQVPSDDDIHRNHKHAQPKPKDSKGSGHDLNMRGVFLHVMGDALGNIGVIASALIIWLTDWPWRHYVDPGISLLITVIILCSAIPLCKAASRILLQAVPHGLSIDHIKDDIEELPGVIGSHHLHVWQLSDTKVVASLHIQVDTDIKDEGSEGYMRLARQVRKCLHAYGIHSSTIQPEFAPYSDAEDNNGGPSSSRGSHREPSASKQPSRDASIRDGDSQACLLECDENCVRGGECCPQKPAT